MLRKNIGDLCFRGLHQLTENNVKIDKKTGKLKCKTCLYAYRREAYLKRGKEYESILDSTRTTQLRKAGWTKQSYEKTAALQQNRCAICKKLVEKRLHADHKHVDPPFPRELLCYQCNPGLGMFYDNPELLEAAAAYLRKHEALYERWKNN